MEFSVGNSHCESSPHVPSHSVERAGVPLRADGVRSTGSIPLDEAASHLRIVLLPVSPADVILYLSSRNADDRMVFVV